MAVARVAREAKTSTPARRTSRERRGGAAIAVEKRASESSPIWRRRILFAMGRVTEGVWDLGLEVTLGSARAGPRRGSTNSWPGGSPGTVVMRPEISTSTSISDQSCVRTQEGVLQ
jgi:hypothetical protein